VTPLVLGIGNPSRGDDAVGHLVSCLLRPRLPSSIRVIEHGGEATALLAVLEGATDAWLIDAAQSDAAPGTIHRIDCEGAVVSHRAVSSHGFGIAEAIELARALGTLPRRCIVYAIEAADFTAGAPLSPPVTRAAREVAARILAELGYSAAALRPLPAASSA
jgi:hydrogenase maturation protease